MTSFIDQQIKKNQLIGAGAIMSPGSQIRALTAKKARPNKATIRIGNSVERKNPKIQKYIHTYSALNIVYLVIQYKSNE